MPLARTTLRSAESSWVKSGEAKGFGLFQRDFAPLARSRQSREEGESLFGKFTQLINRRSRLKSTEYNLFRVDSALAYAICVSCIMVFVILSAKGLSFIGYIIIFSPRSFADVRRLGQRPSLRALFVPLARTSRQGRDASEGRERIESSRALAPLARDRSARKS